MADETTPATDVAPVEPEAPVTEVAPVEETAPVTEVAPVESVAVLDANIGSAPAQTFGPPNPPSTSAPVEETFLATDRVITDHNDPAGTKDQFLGATPPAPLPLAGANGDVRTPEQKLAQA